MNIIYTENKGEGKSSFCENEIKWYPVWMFKNAFLVLEKSPRHAEVIGTRLHASSSALSILHYPQHYPQPCQLDTNAG
ncbi:hypothetical protein HmCmsJML182_02641 [Escherichia coli]|nr:hypothetical protein HmCmsJML182_02641 [Escherichia coli]